MLCPAPTPPLPPAATTAPVAVCPRFPDTFTFPSETHLGICRSQGDPARGPGKSGELAPRPQAEGAAEVFSLDGASGWVLANLSSLLEVPHSQQRMERECDPMQSPWLLRAHLWKGELCSVWRRGGFND